MSLNPSSSADLSEEKQQQHDDFSVDSSSSSSIVSPISPLSPVYHAPRHRPSVFRRVSLHSCSIDFDAVFAACRQQYMTLSICEVSEWLERVVGGQRTLDSFICDVKRRQSLEVEKQEEKQRLANPADACPRLFDALQTGVLLCHLANAVQPSLKLSCRTSAVPGNFMARDNINRFLQVCLSSWSVPRSQLFEVNDLVERKNDRSVVNSLLDISRCVYRKFNIEPPEIIKLEMEIAEIEQRGDKEPTPILAAETIEQQPTEKAPSAAEEQAAVPEPVVEALPVAVDPVPAPVPVPAPLPAPVTISKPRGHRYLPYHPCPTDPLDVCVGGLLNRYQLDLLVKRLVPGQYYIGEQKVSHLRLVRQLVLVRVGGGWEPFVPFTSRKIIEQQE